VSDSPAAESTVRILILGGGAAGRAALDVLSSPSLPSAVALVEPSSDRYDQPAWLRVGTEGLDKQQTRARESVTVPPDVTWFRQRATQIDPEARTVTLADGTRVGYEYLLVALGVETHWARIRHLQEHLGGDGICSVYGYEQAERTWEMIQSFEGGRALFTAPSTPFKGGGAPLQVLRRAEAVWREAGIRERTELYFTTAADPDVAGESYAALIERADTRDDIRVYTGYELVDVRPQKREAVFQVTKGHAQSEDVLPYDFLHVVPPMRPPALLEESGLAYRNGPLRGYLEVDPDTLRHKRFETVFGVGDALGLEGPKTAERAREQARAVAERLRRLATAG
jgi:sulfide:quinone oxidoreductase